MSAYVYTKFRQNAMPREYCKNVEGVGRWHSLMGGWFPLTAYVSLIPVGFISIGMLTHMHIR